PAAHGPAPGKHHYGSQAGCQTVAKRRQGLVFRVSFGTVSGALGVGAACGTVRGHGWPRRAYRDVFTACPASRPHTQGLPKHQYERQTSNAKKYPPEGGHRFYSTARALLHAKVIHDPLGRLAPFPDGRYHQVGATHHVATGKDFLVAGLERERLLLRRLDATGLVRANAFLVEPVGRARAETERNDDRIGRQHLLAARNRFRTTATVGIGLAHARFHHFHAGDLATFADNLDRLAVVQELHALFLRVRHFATRTRHVLLVTTVGTGDACRALANRGAVTVHRRVTTTEHHYALALHVDEVGSAFLEAEVAVGIGHQER